MASVTREEVVEELVASGLAAWPSLRVDREAFASHLRAMFADGAPPSAAELHAADLALAFACAAGDADAWRELDGAHLRHVPDFVARVDAAPGFGDEVRQRVAEKLVGPEGKLRGYSGRGPLGGFLRVVAVREAQSMVRARRPAGGGEVEVEELEEPGQGPELALLKRHSADTFRRAYAKVLAALDDETRTTLRLYFVDGLTYEQLGRALACSRATAARRVTEARELLVADVQKAIREELGPGAPGAETLFALVESQLQLSIARHLGGGAGDG
jgi:RNA polymerase sigma-70 factor (ECF subfamily)